MIPIALALAATLGGVLFLAVARLGDEGRVERDRLRPVRARARKWRKSRAGRE